MTKEADVFFYDQAAPFFSLGYWLNKLGTVRRKVTERRQEGGLIFFESVLIKNSDVIPTKNEIINVL